MEGMSERPRATRNDAAPLHSERNCAIEGFAAG